MKINLSDGSIGHLRKVYIVMKLTLIAILLLSFPSAALPNSFNELENNLILVERTPNKAEISGSQQQKSVTGKVTDNSGIPLPGVTVVIKGTTIGTTTDAEGKYSIPSVRDNSSLQFSFVGMLSKEIEVGGKTTINIKLEEETVGIQEVVAIGYGTVQKKDLTGSISQIQSATLKDLPVARVDQALSGKLAGVQVLTTTGKPGAAPVIRIRVVGSSSAGTDPLYVVDGYPVGDIQMLNPNDIESIDILKDASATAIYGSRGANGVVIINTKRGKQGSSKISLDTYFGWQQVLRTPEFLTTKEQAQYYYEGVKNQNLDANKSIGGNPAKDWYY